MVPEADSTKATLAPSSDKAGEVGTWPPAAVMLYDHIVVAETPSSSAPPGRVAIGALQIPRAPLFPLYKLVKPTMFGWP